MVPPTLTGIYGAARRKVTEPAPKKNEETTTDDNRCSVF
jgi:hypothetical protein